MGLACVGGIWRYAPLRPYKQAPISNPPTADSRFKKKKEKRWRRKVREDRKVVGYEIREKGKVGQKKWGAEGKLRVSGVWKKREDRRECERVVVLCMGVGGYVQ